MLSYFKRTLIGALTVGMICLRSLSGYGQIPNQPAPEIVTQRPQPPMQNVFFNVLWGSLAGGVLMMGWAALDDTLPTDERYTVSNMSTQFLAGATYGGILGLAAGIYISFQGITFDENRTKIAFFQPPQGEQLFSAGYGRNQPELAKQDLHLIDFQYRF